jgi:hypothetical protein
MEKDTNDRSLSPYDIINLQETEDGSPLFATAGVYNPLSQTIWTWYGDGIIFPDGTTGIPSDTITTSKTCGYPDKDE